MYEQFAEFEQFKVEYLTIHFLFKKINYINN